MAGLTSTGYIARTASDWFDFCKEQYEQAVSLLGLSLPSWSRFEFVTLVFRVFAQALSEIDDAVATLFDSFDPNQVTGYLLKQLAFLAGTPIFEGSKSRATCNVTAWAMGSVFLSKGTVASDGTNRWLLTADVNILASATESVVFEAEEAGPIQALAGAINERVSGIAGWTVVTNPAAAIAGEDADSNAVIRRKVYEGLGIQGSRSDLAIQSVIQQVSGVQTANLKYNDDIVPLVVSGRTIPACGVGIWVYPDTLTDDEKAQVVTIMAAMLSAATARSLPTTTGADGVLATLPDAGGGEKVEGFWWVQPARHRVRVTVDSYEAGGTLATVIEIIQAEVRDYFSLLKPGQALRQQDIVGRLVVLDGVARVTVEIDDAPYAGAWDELDRTIDAGNVAALDTDVTTDVEVV